MLAVWLVMYMYWVFIAVGRPAIQWEPCHTLRVGRIGGVVMKVIVYML